MWSPAVVPIARGRSRADRHDGGGGSRLLLVRVVFLHVAHVAALFLLLALLLRRLGVLHLAARFASGSSLGVGQRPGRRQTDGQQQEHRSDQLHDSLLLRSLDLLYRERPIIPRREFSASQPTARRRPSSFCLVEARTRKGGGRRRPPGENVNL